MDGGDELPPEALTCQASSGKSPEELLRHIETIVVLCMENRSFDHYLGSLSLLEGRKDVLGLSGTESNPSASGTMVKVHKLDDFTPADPAHDWDAMHTQWNNGANDGFVISHEGADEADVMGYHVREQLPALYALADAGVVCNRWHGSVLGPTWPNRFYLHGATSNGNTGNFPPIPGFRNIFEVLSDAGISSTNFYHDVAWASGGYLKVSGLEGVETFFDQARNGTLPQYCLIDPHFFGDGANDDHPDHDVQLGQALIATVIRALATSPQWERCLFVLTYDEHGGFFDHVAPPTTVDERPEFAQLGMRVPAIVAGPTVRRGCAIDDVLEHTSVLSTLTRRFKLEPFNERVTATTDLSVCIDAARIGDPLPPPEIEPLPISMQAIARRPPVTAHSELAAALAARPVPARFDRRDRSDEVTRLWLERAAKLGAVRIID